MKVVKVVRPTVKVKMEIEPSSLPLPLQVILRGVRSLIDKLADGADLEVVHSETAFEARSLTRRLLLEYNKEESRMKIMFEKYFEDRFFTKCSFIQCDLETAKDVLHYVRVMLCDAIDTLTVRVPDSMLLLFGVKAEVQEAQTA
jgi:hypothetical protein